ncbi:PilZ domain-containing protein [Sphingomonas sanxanigenens]|uniref:PilZ domain-containing protein n=1 Tax=Sphingomonas sanxanigenens DSM 19645 = NX02 TaxID=1123269 RepID=W0AD14_9SPHN|nr:PilZ domain-containing protein [Sphingomonas sanxanigenens]AHE54188.1 hypothetical protein NX02_12435 [Sphingomonas sanxanigenens DSM 19645 = NX02]
MKALEPANAAAADDDEPKIGTSAGWSMTMDDIAPPPPPLRLATDEDEARAAGTAALSVLQIGKLITAENQSLCTLHSVTANGATAQATVALAVGTPVAIGFRSSHILTGRVASSRNMLTTVVFDEPADIESLLAVQHYGVSGRFLPDSVRVEVFGTVKVEVDGLSFDTELFDISLSGAKLADLEPFMIGTRIILSIEGLPMRSGYIRWRRDGRAGVAFNLGMPFEVLSAWVLEQPSRLALDTLGTGTILPSARQAR